MSYVLSVSKNKPRGLWPLDMGLLNDYSGFGQAALLTGGTPAVHAPLTANATRASIVGDGLGYNFPFPYARPGFSSVRFTVEAWVYPVRTAKVSILSHDGQYDLLSYENGVVSFRLDFVDSGTPSAILSHTLDANKAMHVVGVYSTNIMNLYVNGNMVSQYELSDGQSESEIAVTNNNSRIYTGQGAGARMAVQGVAWYDRPLTDAQVFANFAAGRKTVPAAEVGGQLSPNNVQTSMQDLPVFLREVTDTDEEWEEGALSNMQVADDTIMPQVDESGVSLPATWMGQFPLDFADTQYVQGVIIEWEADGASVAVSLDGTTWESVASGTRINSVKDGFASTGKDLWLRVSFPGLKSQDQSYMESLSVTGYTAPPPTPPTLTREPNLVTTTGNATRRQTAEPITYRDDAGTLLQGGTMTITPDSSTEVTYPRTIEFWAKRLDSTDLVVNPSGTQYVNGAPSSADGPVGEWCLYHVTTTADMTAPVTITGQCIVNGVRFYNKTLSAVEVASAFAAFIGVPTISVVDSSALSLTEPSDSVKIYASDWTVTTTG